MRVDIWTDLACPHCYYGSRNLLTALALRGDRPDVQVFWRSFQLMPGPPAPDRDPGEAVPSLFDALARFNGSREAAEAAMARIAPRAASAGLDFRPDLVRPCRTMNAHRMVHLAAEHGLAGQAVARLYGAYWAEGRDLAHHDTLVSLVAEVGVPADEAREVLSGDRFEAAVHADRAEGLALGIGGVPSIVIDGRYAVSGTAAAEDLAEVLAEVTEGLPTP
ncbi:DsbA family oxidoreductase [Streptomyces hokutonensis]|uniref:DsbA family oxidoreductase n=1 Tax=Streptomyces hokutonensis TaxID=1306990 RepID=UPI000370E974|nr:DsbA family oxidoreductase [Streptomyces hokutonensis]